MLRRWWSKKYGLPATHEAFTSQPSAAVMLEWFEDLWEEHATFAATQKVRHLEKLEFERWERVCAILALAPPGRTGDPVIDAFERALAEGRPIDLDSWQKPKGAR